MTVKIPISADVGQVAQEVNKVPQQVETQVTKTAQKLQKIKWTPIDIKSVERDLKKLEQLITDFNKRVGGVGFGGGAPGVPLPGAVPASPPGVPPPTPSGSRGRATGRHSRTYAPDITDVGRNLLGGFGGGFGTIAGYGTRGAIAGAREGGIGGGGIGLLRGLGIGMLAFGALKLGQGVSEGYTMAKDRAIVLDTLKRQMGDLGTSFQTLKAMSENASQGLGVNALEAAKLAEEFNKVSKSADKTEEGLLGSARTSIGVARAYGIDPRSSVGFFAGMRNMDPRQNNRELALMLAETVQRSGMNGRVEEVMQTLQSFASATSRMILSAPNIGAFAGAYSSMVGSGTPGLTSDVAANILSQANSSIMRMGGAGEAGQNFILAALNRYGTMNPIAAAALAEGGLFGTRAGVFAPGGAIGRYMGWTSNPFGGAGENVTNFEAIREHLSRLGGNKWFQLEGAKRLFGVGSLSQAAALLTLSSQDAGGLQRMLGRAGVDLNSLNETGIQTIAGIGAAQSKEELSAIFGDMRRRTGKGALTRDEIMTLEQAQGGSVEEFRDALLKIASLKDQQETEGSRMREGLKRIEDAQIKVGDKLIGPINTMRDALLLMSGQRSERSLREKVAAMEREDVMSRAQADATSALSVFSARRNALKAERQALVNKRRASRGDKAKFDAATAELAEFDRTYGEKLGAIQAKEQARIDEIYDARDRELTELKAKQDAESAALSGGGVDSARRAKIADLERKYNLPPGMLLGVWGTESSFGKNIGPSSAGARGHFQFMPGTAKRYGVTIGDFDSEAEGAAQYLRDLYGQRGSWKGALYGYNGVVKNTHLGEEYVSRVERYGGLVVDGATPLPNGASAAAPRAQDSLNVNINYAGQLTGADGRTITHGARTQVSVPRGSGTRSASLEAY